MAYTHNDRLNVSAGRANLGKQAALEIRRGTRRETPALGTCRTGALPGAKRLGSKAVGSAGAATSFREEEKSPPPVLR
ncbi:hypothetical protein NDU88_000547 [Pleurodeles waltl]|uniref:Uncharacterized protein n=1 Tax=Pleurodeles waltl TaxID=8319 RepID=A0AAV7L6X7_PLEWA|nr:hypothetical protein NDU88_000547 [Pleurodeles waltl]